MNLFQALILGLVQGLTEYIPVSSSAHLVLVPWFLGWPDPSFEFEVLIQLGTLVGVIVYFWADLLKIAQAVIAGLLKGKPVDTFEARLGWLVVVATLPAVVLGGLFKDYFEQAYSAPIFVGGLLILTASLLTLAEWVGRRERHLDSFTWLDAVVVGFWQALAMLPGISRSGATISGAMLKGFDRPDAARFSFLMSIPAMLGAGVLAIKDLVEAGNVASQLPAITVGFVAAMISGYLCIRWLLGYLQRHSLYGFAAYCAALSGLTIITAVWRGLIF
jgi:undecaprenyl-diphosphatase